jgi:hypothetical protein
LAFVVMAGTVGFGDLVISRRRSAVDSVRR